MATIVNSRSLGSNPPPRRVIVRPPANTMATAVKSTVPFRSERTERERVIPAAEVYRLPTIPYDKFRRHLMSLNPSLIVREGHRIPELVNQGLGKSRKIHIGVPYPAHHNIKQWEALTWWEKRQIEALTADDKPRVWSVAISPGHLSPFVTLVSEAQPGLPQEVIARSVKSILTRLVADQAFSWSEAEAEFGVSWRDYPDRIEVVRTVRTKCWDAEQDERRAKVLDEWGREMAAIEKETEYAFMGGRSAESHHKDRSWFGSVGVQQAGDTAGEVHAAGGPLPPSEQSVGRCGDPGKG